MVGTITARPVRIQTRIRNMFAVAAAVAIVAAVACGSDDPAPAAAPTAVPAQTATPDALPDVVVAAVEPEAGSDEAAILELFERVVRTINTEDWDAYVGNCNPTRPVMSASQVEFFFADNPMTARVELAGLNYRNVTFRVFDDGTAITKGDEYSFEEPTIDVQYSWAKVDGQWYFSSNCGTAVL